MRKGIKWIFFLLSIVLIVVGGFFLYNTFFLTHEIPELEVPGKLIADYVEVGKERQIPWYYLAAMDEVENHYEQVNRKTIEGRADQIEQRTGKGPLTASAVASGIRQLYPKEKADQVIAIAEGYQWAAAPLDEEYLFPFHKEDRKKVSYGDTWGAGRSYGGERKHEGTDLMAPEGTPIRSVSEGQVVSKGWNTLGGWRLSIRDEQHPQMIYYYAHLSKYAEGLEKGDHVKKGEIIGYVGDSGYGPEGTTGQFAPHLHFGIYVRPSLLSPMRKAINPYPFLKAWESEGQ